MAACWQEQLHYHATKSQLSAQNKHTLMPTKAINMRSHTVWIIVTLIKCVSLKSQWLAFTGHSDLSMSNQPHPRGTSYSKYGIHLVRHTKSKAHWVMLSDDHPTHILHPTWGIAYALLHQEGQISQCASPVITNCSFIPASAILFLPFSFLLLSLTFKQTSNYPGMSVLRCWDSACHDHMWPYSNCIKWDHITIKWVICAQYGWIGIGTIYPFTAIICLWGS